MPTWNSRISSNTNNCFVDRERKIAFTDGGNQVKDFAQLNALIIDCADGEMSFSTVFESWYPRFTAKTDFDSGAPYGSFKDHWPEGELEVISHGEDFSYLQRTDGSTLYAANTHLNIKDGKAVFVRNTVSAFLKVKKGETLELLDAPKGNYVFVRNGAGDIGWVKREVLP